MAILIIDVGFQINGEYLLVFLQIVEEPLTNLVTSQVAYG